MRRQFCIFMAVLMGLSFLNPWAPHGADVPAWEQLLLALAAAMFAAGAAAPTAGQ